MMKTRGGDKKKKKEGDDVEDRHRGSETRTTASTIIRMRKRKCEDTKRRYMFASRLLVSVR